MIGGEDLAVDFFVFVYHTLDSEMILDMLAAILARLIISAEE